MSDSVRPHRWQPTRLPHPWDSPGKNTGVGCHFLVQHIIKYIARIEVSKVKVAQSHPTLCDSMDCSLSGSSVHGIFQARVLEWISISFSRGSFWPRNRTWVSCIASRRFTVWAMRSANCIAIGQVQRKVCFYKENFIGTEPYTWAFQVMPLVKNLPANVGEVRDVGWIPGLTILWRRKWQSTPVFLPGESYGQRKLVSYSPEGCKESDMTKVT